MQSSIEHFKGVDAMITDLLLPEFDQEMSTTRRVLERVPDDKLAWKPHDRSWSMGNLASHITNLIKWTDATMNATEFDLASVTPEQMNQSATSRAELLSWFDANIVSARQALAKSDADYFVPWTLKTGATTHFTMPRVVCVRSFFLNHVVHHRGQLSVYLRLNNIPVPSIYGPSADEASA
jgi:uncharacterized damage-inducible protein DinB